MSASARKKEQLQQQKSQAAEHRLHLIIAFLLFTLAMMCFEVFLFPRWTWLHNHPQSYGLHSAIWVIPGTAIFLWLVKAWRTALGAGIIAGLFIALYVLVATLLGGPPLKP